MSVCRLSLETGKSLPDVVVHEYPSTWEAEVDSRVLGQCGLYSKTTLLLVGSQKAELKALPLS